MNKKSNTVKVTCSSLCLAIAMVLPLLTGQIPKIGAALCPMHLPVLLCGYVCGWPWGLAVGFISPLLRSLTFGMPPLFPSAFAMSFELAGYGIVSGLLYKLLPKKVPYIYISLIAAMICGRAVWGCVQYAIAGLRGSEFPFAAFLAGAVSNAVPGIIMQILLIPVLVLALKKAGLIANE